MGLFNIKRTEVKTIGRGKVISVINQKGGVGKTTVAFNVCHALAKKGKRVLAIDCDPQMNFGALFGTIDGEYNIFHLLINSVRELKAMHQPVMLSSVVQTIGEIDVIPSGQELSGFELTVAGITAPRQLVLKKFIEKYELQSMYDYIIIDSPPTLGLVMVNILSASGGILVPFKPDDFSQIGLKHLHEVIENIEEMGVTQTPEVIKYIPNLVEGRRKQDMMHLDAIKSEIEKEFSQDKVSDVFYNRAYFAKSQSAKKSIFDYRAKEFHDVQESFLSLATSIEEWADGQEK